MRREHFLKLFIFSFAVIGGTVIIGHFIQGWYQFFGGLIVGISFWILIMEKLEVKPEDKPYDPVEPLPYNQIRFNKQMIAINRFCSSYIESATLGDKQTVLVPIQVLWQIRDLANHARQFTPVED